MRCTSTRIHAAGKHQEAASQGIASNCHESSVAATEIDIRNLPRTELPTGLLKYGIPLIKLSLTGRGVSRGAPELPYAAKQS
jgi:hypothetical protein